MEGFPGEQRGNAARERGGLQRVAAARQRARVGEDGRRPAEKAENRRFHRTRPPGDRLSFAGHRPCQEGRQHCGDREYTTERTRRTHTDLLCLDILFATR